MDPAWDHDIENWSAPFFEVAVDLGSKGDDRLRAAFRAAWSHPALRGPLPGRNGSDLETPFVTDHNIWTFGTVSVPGVAGSIGAVIMAVRDSYSDWLDVAIPEGGLDEMGSIGASVEAEIERLGGACERLLVEIADHINAVVPFDLATVGEEVSGVFRSPGSHRENAITRDVIEKRGGFLVSPRLWTRLRPSVHHDELASGMRWVRLFRDRSDMGT